MADGGRADAFAEILPVCKKSRSMGGEELTPYEVKVPMPEVSKGDGDPLWSRVRFEAPPAKCQLCAVGSGASRLHSVL